MRVVIDQFDPVTGTHTQTISDYQIMREKLEALVDALKN